MKFAVVVQSLSHIWLFETPKIKYLGINLKKKMHKIYMQKTSWIQ